MSSNNAIAVATPRVVWGVAAIAATINRSTSETRWLIKQRRLRVKQHGRRTFSALEHELFEDVSGGPLAAE